MKLLFKDNSTVDFVSNKRLNGGALSLFDWSVLKFYTSHKRNSEILLNFTSNEDYRGGAIYYVEDIDYISIIYHNLRKSVFEFQSDTSNIELKFFNKLAQIGGNQIYGAMNLLRNEFEMSEVKVVC